MAKKTTQYTKNRNRILRYIKRHKITQYVDLYIPTELQLRKQGVKGTELAKLTRKLKGITPKYLKQEATQSKEREERELKTDNVLENGISQVIINNFKSQILHFPKEISVKVIAFINTLINEQGIDSVAYSLEHMPLQFHEILNKTGYDSNSAMQEFASSLVEYLPDASDAYKKDLIEAFEYNELGYNIED